MTLHTAYYRTSPSGVTEQAPFSDVDGIRFGVRFQRGEGVVFRRDVALEIVNRWNEISATTNNGTVYYL
jgi:hypothetical protein